MKTHSFLSAVVMSAVCLIASSVSAQITTSLPGRSIVKLLPDYTHPRVLALNQANGSVPGTLLALNPTNGSIINEIAVNLNPTDMAVTPAGDAVYVINTGSRTITKVDLGTFAVVSEKPISTPVTYSLSNPLYVVAGQSGQLFYTDGAWGPEIYFFDYNAGTNVMVLNTGGNGDFGAGGMALNRAGTALYAWRQYGWGAGNVNSWVTRYGVSSGGSLTALEDSFTSWRRDPLDTPVFLDAAERWVFNKQQMFVATNVTVLLNQFADNIYGISLDGTIAFGPTQVFNTQNGATLTNLPFATTVQTLSGDQKKLFRYNRSATNLVVYDMASIAPVSGAVILPTPADGSVVSPPLTNLTWTVSPAAISYNVYFGTNQSQVATATQASSQYLGHVTSPGQSLSQILSPGATYYWRVDSIGFNSTNTGSVWSFTVSALSITPSQLAVSALAGFNPPSQTLSITSAVFSTTWSAAVTGAGWLTLNPTSGVAPVTATVAFNTAALPAGIYTNNIEFTSGGIKYELPVTITVKPLNIVKMAADLQRPYIYALQAPALSGQNGSLLFINTSNGIIEKMLTIGVNPVDLTIHSGENRLYIASWGENATYVVDLASQSLLPSLSLGTDVYKINAGKPGRIVIEGEDQWVGVSMIDTATGATVGSMPWPEREGDGEMNPTGTYYYHSDNNISNAHIHKEQIVNDVAAEVAGSNEHPYGSRNLILSPDGTTLFWQGYVYDANLNELGSMGEQVYATTAHGDLALGTQHAFNSHNGQALYTWPFSCAVMAVSGDQQKVFLYDSASNHIVVIPMSSIATVPGPGLNPNPANGSVINPPLPQVSWTVSPLALSYRVYMGTNAAAVAAANTNSTVYLGNTTSNSLALSTVVNPGATYYWRVDSVGFAGITTGMVWSFTVSALTITPQTLSLSGVTGLPILPQAISLTAPLPTSWNLNVAQPWISVSAGSGVTPSSVTLNFNTTNLTAGTYTNQLTFTANGIALQLPVTLQLFDLNAFKIVADPKRNYIYVLHPGSGNLSDAFLLFLNTDTGVVEKVIPIGINPTDMTVNRFEDRLYVSNWQHNQTHVVDLKTQTELSSLALGTDVYKINAGVAGRLVAEGEDQWVYASLINTVSGSTITSIMVREGDGEFDPTGRYYYHVDNNSSGAVITKYDMGSDAFSSLGSAGPHYYYGSRNLVMSLDGSRLFWTSAMYNANLTDLGVIGAEIYACSTNGGIAFSSQQAYDTSTKLVIYNLPVNSSVEGVDRMNQKLWYFNASTHRIENLPLLVIQQPSITQQPATNTSIPLGGNINLSVTAMGLNPLFYQWMFSGTNLVGQTNYFLSLNNIQPSQQGNYQVIVSNPYGAVTSTVAQVTVLTAPTIVKQPVGTNVFAGQTFTLAVTAGGTAPLAYQWTFENVNIAGATNSILVVTNAQAANEGIYRVTVQNSAGLAISGLALVRVAPAAPSITAGPISLVVPAATNVVFAVTATGSRPMSYQWLFNGTAILGATTPQYSIANAQSWNAGNYQAVVANGFGSVTSSPASLGVTPVVPYFVVQPVGTVLSAGTNWTLTSQARGSEPLSYYWQHDGVAMSGACQTSLTLTNLRITDSGNYAFVAFNTSGSSTSLVASITITAAPPVFVQQPVSTSALVSASVTFNSLANGSNPLRYQWYFQNSPLLSQTNRQLTLNPVAANAAGSYFVIASNQFGSTTSSVAQLTVNQPPVLQQALSNIVVNADSNVTLAISATGNAPLTYAWQFNGTTIAGTNSSLLLTNVRPAQSGFYRVTINNQYGSATSTVRVSVFGVAGLVVAWGDNSGGQTNAPSSFADAVAIAGGDYHSLALRQNGTLAAWGYNGDGQTAVPADTLRFVSIAAGASHNLAVRENGSLVSWGRNDAGQTNVPATATNVLAVAAGDSHSLALLGSRTIVAWGDNSYGQTSIPQGLTGIAAIAAGRLDSLALRTNGTVVGWGFNTYGQTTPPVGLSNVIAIAAGYLHSAALRANGTVVVWGDNTYGQMNVPASVSNVVAIAAGDFDTLALRADGKVIGWGDDYYQEIDVPPTLANVFAIAAGNYHGLAISPVTIQGHMTSAGLVLEWSSGGALQWAPSPAGPFTDVPCQGNCFTNLDMSAPAKFFRVRQ